MTNKIFAIYAALAASPVNPKIPAMSAKTKNVSAHDNILPPYFVASTRRLSTSDH